MSIAIIGRRGSGKTTTADLLVEYHGYTRHSWAAPVKEIAEWAYGPVDKAGTYEVSGGERTQYVTGRWLLQHIGTDAIRNNVDSDFWVKAGVRRIDTAPGQYVNDDSRFPNELMALRERGFKIIALDVPADLRRRRLGLGTAEFDEADAHASETSVGQDDADLVIDATLPIVDVLRAVVEYVQVCTDHDPDSGPGSDQEDRLMRTYLTDWTRRASLYERDEYEVVPDDEIPAEMAEWLAAPINTAPLPPEHPHIARLGEQQCQFRWLVGPTIFRCEAKLAAVEPLPVG